MFFGEFLLENETMIRKMFSIYPRWSAIKS